MKERSTPESHQRGDDNAVFRALKGSNEAHKRNRHKYEMKAPLMEQEQEVLPAGFHPESIRVEHLPAETIHLVEVALPEQGRVLLAHLLRYATCTPQSTLPAAWASLSEHEDRERRALVVVRSLKALARAEGAPCGPDRYYQLVLVLEALQVLKRRVHRTRVSPHEYVTVLSVSLDPQPCPLPTLLRSCSQVERTYANPKVKRLLIQARERLHATLQASAAPELHQIVSQMEHLAQRYHAQGLPQAPLLALVQQVLSALLYIDSAAQHQETMDTGISAPGWQVSHDTDGEGVSSLMAEATYTISLSDQDAEPPSQEESFLPDVGKKLPVDSFSCSQAQSSSPKRLKQGFHREKKKLQEPETPKAWWEQAEQRIDASATVEPFLPEGGKKLPDEENRAYMETPTRPYRVSTMVWPEQDTHCEHAVSDAMDAQDLVSGKKQPEHGKKPQPPSSHVVTSFAHRGDELTIEVGSFLPESGKKLSASVSINDSSFKTRLLENEESMIDPVISSYHDPRPIQEIRHEAQRYARLLDGDERWLGKLVNCIKQYPPHIRRLAAIGTLSRLYGPQWRGQIQHPGAWFCRTCERFTHNPNMIPESVQQWAATTLDYEEIATALQQGYAAPTAPSHQVRHASTLRPAPTGSIGGDEAGQDRMDQHRAEYLRARIEQEVQEGSEIGAYVQMLPELHTGIWRIVLIWEDGIEVPLANEAQWISYWTSIQKMVPSHQRAEGGHS